jgi:guanylate kinase
MVYTSIVITGTSGAGKSTFTRNFVQTYDQFQQCVTVTTREMRADDTNDYKYYTKKEFLNVLSSDWLSKWHSRGEYYGILKTDYNDILEHNKIPIILISAESVKNIIDPLNINFSIYMPIFIDAKDNTLNSRLYKRKSVITSDTVRQRSFDRLFEDSCFYILKNEKNAKIESEVKLIKELWDHRISDGNICRSSVYIFERKTIIFIPRQI